MHWISLCTAVSRLVQVKRRCERLVIAHATLELSFYAAEGSTEAILFTPAFG